jgi:hypothetical protein
VSDDPPSPADAKKALYQILTTPGVKIVKSYVVEDLANLRRACPHDVDFAEAILAIASEIRCALRLPEEFGIAVAHELEGWRRSKFPSRAGEKVHLRLVFRPAKPRGIEILAFGDREFPDSVYHTAKERTV